MVFGEVGNGKVFPHISPDLKRNHEMCEPHLTEIMCENLE